MPDKFCHNCRFWERDEDSAFNGECHRRAPRPSNSVIDSDDGAEGKIAVWPITLNIEWCGEWSAKESPSRDEQ